MNFKIDTKNYLGQSYNSFNRRAYSVALSQPDRFQQIRDDVIQSLINNTVEQVYQSFYNVLTTGRDNAGAQITRELGAPSYPEQKTSAFALRAAQTVQKLCEEACDLILPVSAKQIAEARMTAKSLASDAL
jgi:hypothetical protein